MTGGRRLDAGGIWAMGGMTRAGGGGGVGTKKEEASWRKRTRSQASIGVRVWLRASSASAQGIDSEGGKVERKEARRASSVGVLSRGGEGRVCCLKSQRGRKAASQTLRSLIQSRDSPTLPSTRGPPSPSRRSALPPPRTVARRRGFPSHRASGREPSLPRARMIRLELGRRSLLARRAFFG